MPPVRYLVGLDESEAAKAALRFAGTLAEATGAEVEAVRAIMLGAENEARMGTSAREREEQAVHRQAADDGVLVTARAEHGAPAPLLCRRAELRKAVLLVVGRTHRGRFGRVLPGSVGERLIAGAPCAVAVVPPEGRAHLHRIAVAYDGRPPSEAALTTACDLARATGAELVLAGASEPLEEVTVEPDSMLLSQRRVRRERLEQVLAERRSTLDPELRVETAVLAGRPSDALIEFAAETDVDLIVTGSRHWGPLFAAVAGSTSRRLADRAPCPVLIAPRGHGRPLVAPGTADLAGRV